MQSNPMIWLIAGGTALGALISFIHEPEGAFDVGALVQKKTGGIHGMVDSQLEPDSDHPKAWVRWDDGNYSVHPENELLAATPDGPQFYKTI